MFFLQNLKPRTALYQVQVPCWLVADMIPAAGLMPVEPLTLLKMVQVIFFESYMKPAPSCFCSSPHHGQNPRILGNWRETR